MTTDARQLLKEARDALESLGHQGEFTHSGGCKRCDVVDRIDAYLASRATSGDGWVMVPREPTQAMWDAAIAEEKRGGVIDTIWPAMLAAAPNAQEE